MSAAYEPLTARVADLLDTILEADQAAQSALLDQLAAAHPDCAVALRQGYASLQQLQLVGTATPSHQGAEPMPVRAGLPRQLGPFRLLELLGSGGMGSVYRAHDDEQRRTVALKLIRGELLASESTKRRFQRESEALARLDHECLCTVFRAGTTDGQPWIAMRYVPGTSLAARIAERRQQNAEPPTSGAQRRTPNRRADLELTLALFERIAEGLHTAHAAGVIHRDIKPANIVLEAHGRPCVIDFGLVHIEDSTEQLTLSSDQVGTPAYMAPEQIAASSRRPGAATDVYALGTTLFEALTLQSPYEAGSREELFHHIVKGERRRLRQVDHALPVDLELVLEKALDVDPARRYASMAEFAADLARVRRHEPPLAKRLSPALRLRRWSQRNPVATAIVVLLALGLGVAMAMERSRRSAQQHSLAMAYGNLAEQLIAENPEHALDLALRAAELAPGNPEVLGTLLQSLQEVHDHEVWPLPWTTPQKWLQLRVAPDGEAVLILDTEVGQRTRPPLLWRGSGPVPLPVQDGAYDAAWSEDGSTFVTTGPDGPPRLWSADGALLATVEVPNAPGIKVPRARFLGPSRIVFACSDGLARIWDRDQEHWLELEPRLALRQPGMPGLAVSGDGQRLALGDRDGRIVVHSTAEALAGRPGRVVAESGIPAIEVDLDATGALVQVSSLEPYRCALWTWEGALLSSWGTQQAPATPVELGPSRDRVLEIVQGRLPQLRSRNGDSMAVQCALVGHEGRVADACFGQEGRLLTVGVDGTARVWEAESGRTLHTLRGFDSELTACCFLARDRCLLVTTRSIHCFGLQANTSASLTVGNYRDAHVGFLGDGSIVTADKATRITLHDAAGRRQTEITEPYLRRSGLCIDADGRWLVSTSHAGTKQNQARIYRGDLTLAQELDLAMSSPRPTWGPKDSLLVVDIEGEGEEALALFTSPEAGRWALDPEGSRAMDGKLRGSEAVAWHAPTATLVAAGANGGASLYRWTTDPVALTPAGDLLPGGEPVNQIAISPDGQTFLLACGGRVVRLVTRSGEQKAAIGGYLGTICNLGFAPDGQRFLVAATESGVTVHDLDGNLLVPVRPRSGGVTAAAFLPDASRILLGTTARITRLLPIDATTFVDLARGVAKPPLLAQHRAFYARRVGDTQ